MTAAGVRRRVAALERKNPPADTRCALPTIARFVDHPDLPEPDRPIAAAYLSALRDAGAPETADTMMERLSDEALELLIRVLENGG